MQLDVEDKIILFYLLYLSTLGKKGPQVSQIGLGCMGMSDLYGNKQTRDDKKVYQLSTWAVEEGINFFDTATALLIP